MQLDLPIVGLTCLDCARKVERALRALPGVRQASVNYPTGRATLVADDTADPAGTALRTGRAQVVPDVLRGSLSERWQSEALKRGYRSSCALPLRYGDAVYGVLSVYSDQPRTFDKLERAVLEDVSQTIAYAINAVESKKALTGSEVVELEFEIDDPTVLFVLRPAPPGRR